MSRMIDYVCKECGWRTKGESRPKPKKWADGHRCNFQRVNARISINSSCPPPDTIWLDDDGQPADQDDYNRLRAYIGYWNDFALEKIPEFLESANRWLEKAEASADLDQLAIAKINYAGDVFYFGRKGDHSPIVISKVDGLGNDQLPPAVVNRGGGWQWADHLTEKEKSYLLDSMVADLINLAGGRIEY